METDDQPLDGLEREVLLQRLEASGFFSSGGWVKPVGPLDLGTTKWTPEYVGANAVMTLVLGPSVPLFLQKRIKAAKASGFDVVCVLDWSALVSDEALLLLSAVGAKVILIKDDLSFTAPLPLLKFLGVEELAIQPETRKKLVVDGISACLAATSNDQKGKTLEHLLHFMFSQVQDFKVRDCNYRTATEELDVVVQLSGFNPSRCWAMLGAPILLAEAKNRAAKSSQGDVSKFNTILSVKRGACKIGFIVALAGFTSDARDQVLKLASEDRTFVLLDKAALEQWGAADDFDEELNKLVIDAMLD